MALGWLTKKGGNNQYFHEKNLIKKQIENLEKNLTRGLIFSTKIL